MPDALGNDPVGFELNVLIGKIEALVSVISTMPNVRQSADFAKAREIVRNSSAIQRAPKQHKGAPQGMALQVAMETIDKIEKGTG